MDVHGVLRLFQLIDPIIFKHNFMHLAVTYFDDTCCFFNTAIHSIPIQKTQK